REREHRRGIARCVGGRARARGVLRPAKGINSGVVKLRTGVTAVGLALVLAACGSSANTSSSTTVAATNSTTSSTTSTTTTAPAKKKAATPKKKHKAATHT